MICGSPFAGLNYFSPWADSRFLLALFALGRSCGLSAADLFPQRVQQRRQPWKERQRHQPGPCLQLLAARLAVRTLYVGFTDRHGISSAPLPQEAAESIGEQLWKSLFFYCLVTSTFNQMWLLIIKKINRPYCDPITGVSVVSCAGEKSLIAVFIYAPKDEELTAVEDEFCWERCWMSWLDQGEDIKCDAV